MSDLPDAPATGRNREAILQVLQIELAEKNNLLEIGSGTGQHAVFFAGALPHLQWQTSDRKVNHDGISAWVDTADTSNVLKPIELDVLSSANPGNNYDAVFSANTAHIMSFEGVVRMFEIVAGCLTDDGCFCLYGPFNVDGQFSSSSNEQFNASLQAQDPAMGIRDIEDLDNLADSQKMHRQRTYAMPANNQLLVWKK